MTIVIFFLFFSFSKKREVDFTNFHFVFSISIMLPTFAPLLSPIFTLILRIPTLILIIPTLIPRIPTLISRTFTLISRISYHFPHSIPRFPIPTFTDSHLNLMQKLPTKWNQQLNRYVFSKVIDCLKHNIWKQIDCKRPSNTKQMN